MPPIDDTGQPAQKSGETPGGEAKTTPSGDEAVLAQLEDELSSTEVTEGVGDDQPGQDQSEDEFEDYEHQGKAYKIPKALKPHLMREADYTRSKQEVAEAKRQADAYKASVEAEAKFQNENLEAITDLRHIDRQLKVYDKLDWAKLLQENPTQHQYHLGQLQLLERQHRTLLGDLQQKSFQALEKQNAERSKLAEEGKARIAKKIPNWSNELAGILNEYATANGFSMEELEGFLPRKNADAYAEVLLKAYRYDQLMARTRAKAKQSDAAPALTVVPQVAPRKSPTVKDPSKMSPEEYRTWRQNGGGSPRSAAR